MSPNQANVINTLSLHDALPISADGGAGAVLRACRLGTRPHPPPPRSPARPPVRVRERGPTRDRKSTRLNSSHTVISYAVFCLKKKKKPAALQQAAHASRVVGGA